MELFSALKEFTAITQSLGFLGILFFVWWQGQKERKDDNKRWEERFQSVVKMHEDSVRRYEDNVGLVKSYENFSGDLSGIISLNTQAMTSLTEVVRDIKEELRRKIHES